MYASVGSTYAFAIFIYPFILSISVLAAFAFLALVYDVGYGDGPQTVESEYPRLARLAAIAGALALIAVGIAQLSRTAAAAAAAARLRPVDEPIATRLAVMYSPAATFVVISLCGWAWYCRSRFRQDAATWTDLLGSVNRRQINLVVQARWRAQASGWVVSAAALELVYVYSASTATASRTTSATFNRFGQVILVAELALMGMAWFLWRTANPQYRLVAACSMDLAVAPRDAWRLRDHVPLKLQPGRWRSRSHQAGFAAGTALARYLRGATRRLVFDHAGVVDREYRRLAEALCRRGLVADRSESDKQYFESLRRAALTVVVCQDLPAAAE